MALIELITSNPKVSIVALSFLVTLVMTLVTKKFTNQSRMKELKDIQKACQIKIKSDGVKGNIEEMQKIQKQIMECSMELMKHSFKPIFITFLPLIILFWWVGANLAYYPIMPGEQFSVSVVTSDMIGNVSIEPPNGILVVGNTIKTPILEKKFLREQYKTDFSMIAENAGDYLVSFNYNNQSQSKEILISNTSYVPASESYKGNINNIQINYRNTGFFETYWIWTYIISGIISSIVLRKMLKVV